MSEPGHEAAVGRGTLRGAVRQVADALRAAGIDGGVGEARDLIVQATGLPALTVVSEPARALKDAESRAIAEVLARRLAHEPLTRIAGSRNFYGRDFVLSAATLDPRPDTETLISAVLQLADEQGGRNRPLRILDLGTGTGCILITLLVELPAATGVGIDIVPGAVATAQTNAARLGVAARAAFRQGDGPEGVAGPFDFVVSNPPYIASTDIDRLEREVRDFDPRAALDGGGDGLGFYRLWIPEAVRLAPCGWVVMEVGAGQAAEVGGMMESCALSGPPRTWMDLGGHTRVVAARPH